MTPAEVKAVLRLGFTLPKSYHRSGVACILGICSLGLFASYRYSLTTCKNALACFVTGSSQFIRYDTHAATLLSSLPLTCSSLPHWLSLAAGELGTRWRRLAAHSIGVKRGANKQVLKAVPSFRFQTSASSSSSSVRSEAATSIIQRV